MKRGGLTQTEVAAKLGISRGRVSQIEKKAMAKLRHRSERASHRKFWNSIRSWVETSDVIMAERGR